MWSAEDDVDPELFAQTGTTDDEVKADAADTDTDDDEIDRATTALLRDSSNSWTEGQLLATRLAGNAMYVSGALLSERDAKMLSDNLHTLTQNIKDQKKQTQDTLTRLKFVMDRHDFPCIAEANDAVVCAHAILTAAVRATDIIQEYMHTVQDKTIQQYTYDTRVQVYLSALMNEMHIKSQDSKLQRAQVRTVMAHLALRARADPLGYWKAIDCCSVLADHLDKFTNHASKIDEEAQVKQLLEHAAAWLTPLCTLASGLPAVKDFVMVTPKKEAKEIQKIVQGAFAEANDALKHSRTLVNSILQRCVELAQAKPVT